MNRTLAEGAAILAPHGRDAAIAQAMLTEGGLEAAVVSDLAELVAVLRSGAGFAVVTEEALRSADLRDLAGFIHDQPEWSDFPFILLTARGGGSSAIPALCVSLKRWATSRFWNARFIPPR
ncbi:MAG: hypothetical protein ABIT09_09685 [Croceibacterium sp.]